MFAYETLGGRQYRRERLDTRGERASLAMKPTASTPDIWTFKLLRTTELASPVVMFKRRLNISAGGLVDEIQIPLVELWLDLVIVVLDQVFLGTLPARE